MNEGPERIDYRETSDVTEVHAAIQREHRDPSANVTPIPLWLTAVCGVAVCWAGAYLGVFHGGFSSSIYNEYDSSPTILFPLPEKAGSKAATVATLTLAQQGKAVYPNCVTCHQPSGLGAPGQFPPLVKSEYVLGGEKRLVAILLKGLQGPVTVEGKLFNGVMPPWEKNLSDKKIAAIASFVRSEWGNTAPEISEGKVATGRKEFESQAASWTEAQLLQIPADANFAETGEPAPATPAAKDKPKVPLTGPAAPAASAASASTPNPAPTAGSAAAPVADPAVMTAGKQVYMSVCFACHQPTGLGLPMVFPPLTKSEYVNGSEERFAAMILKGNAGPMTIEGKPYNNMMPGQETLLTDDKVAAVMTYVRSSFGNSAPPVSVEVVTAARQKFIDRKTPWTEPELKAFGAVGNAAPPEAPAAPSTVPSPAVPSPTSVVPLPAAPAAPVPAPSVPASPSPAPASDSTPSSPSPVPVATAPAPPTPNRPPAPSPALP